MAAAEKVTSDVSRDEDAALRRLHYFEALGAELAPGVKALKEDIRARDRRESIREPEDEVEVPEPPRVPGPRAEA